MRRKLNRLTREWEELARNDVFWAVLSDQDKKGGKWSEDDFYERGEKQIRRWMRKLNDFDVKKGRALDFGCGPGRLSFPLGHYFGRVDGVDVSESAIEIARSSSRKLPHLHFHLNKRADLNLFENNSFDFIISLIVLQHMPPNTAREYIKEFYRILKPGGHLFFQLPSHVKPINIKYRLYAIVPNFLIRWYFKLFVSDRPGYMEMNGIPLEGVQDFLSDTGFQVMRIWEDQSAGPAWQSYRYLCTKAQDQR